MVNYYVSGGCGGGGAWTTASTTWNDDNKAYKANLLMRDLYMTPEEAYAAVGLEYATGGGINTQYRGICEYCGNDFEPGQHDDRGEYCKMCFGPRE